MIYVYLFSLIVGGSLVVLSVIGGDHDADADVDADLSLDPDADLSVDHDVDVGHDLDMDHGDAAFSGMDVLSIFFSVRFWTFFMAFGGATGVGLTLLGLLSTVGRAGISGATGFLCGFVAASAIRYLQRDEISSGLSARDWIGKAGRVTVRCHSGQPGKIRIEFEDHVKEIMAISDDGELPAGTDIIILQMDETGVARITPKNRALARNAQAQKTES